MAPKVRLRIDLAPGCSIGPGKIELLELIGRHGSLSQAARELGMSYRRAWLLVDELNQTLQQPVVSKSVGGSRGGGAELTVAGRALAATYRRFERNAEALASRVFAGLKPGPRRVATRARPVKPRRR